MTEAWPELFDRVADRYDQVVPFFAEFAGQLPDVLDPDPGTRLLDIGSGRGAIAAAAAGTGRASPRSAAGRGHSADRAGTVRGSRPLGRMEQPVRRVRIPGS
jgi:hypothetical protein